MLQPPSTLPFWLLIDLHRRLTSQKNNAGIGLIVVNTPRVIYDLEFRENYQLNFEFSHAALTVRAFSLIVIENVIFRGN